MAEDMVELALLGKPGCGLCDEADELLFDLSLDYPLAIVKIDVTGDAELSKVYGDRVPVVQFASGRELAAPLDEAGLRAAIEAELKSKP